MNYRYNLKFTIRYKESLDGNYEKDIIRYKMGQSNIVEFNDTNLKRHLFINEFLYLSVLIWGSWNSWPLFLNILDLFGGNKS